MIKHICGDSDAGIYSFAYQIASAMNILISATNGSRVPWTYEQLKAGIYDRMKSITNALIVLMTTITVLVFLLSPEAIRILGTADYQKAVYVIPVVTLGVFFTFCYDFFASVEFYFGATQYVMVASITGAILNVILNAIFIPIFGFIAAAYTTLVCYIVFMFMHYFFMNRVLKEQMIADSVYDIRFIIIVSIALLGLCFVSMMTFAHPLIRIILIALILMICLINRNQIKNLLRSIK
jgi:O-antigen/teichoic acid export membrane protein